MSTVAAFSTDVIERDFPAWVGSLSEEGRSRWSPRIGIDYQSTSVTLLDEREEWLVAAYKKLSRLAHLEDDWDSYGAEAPSRQSIDAAREVVRALLRADIEPTSIDPSVEGGVCLSFQRGSRYADIECLNSGEILAVTSPDDIDTKVWEVGDLDQQLRSALNRIRTFIGR